MKAQHAVAVGIGTQQHHGREMETKTVSLSSACLIVGFALLCGLHNTEGFPSVDPPQLYPAGLRRAAEPTSLESDEFLDQGPPAPSTPATSPGLNPFLPLIKLKPSKLGPDPSQFIQMKADLLKNLFGPGGIKGPAVRAVSAGAGKWAGETWASGNPATGEKWGATKSKTKPPKPSTTPSPSSPWNWPPAPAPAAPAQSWAAQAPSAPTQSWPAQAPSAPAQSWPAQAPATPVQSWPAQAPSAPAQSWPAQAPATPVQSWPAQAPAAPAQYWPAQAPAAPPQPWPAQAPASSPVAFPPSRGYWIPTSVNPPPSEFMDKKTALVNALLDQILSEPAPAPSSRLARAPLVVFTGSTPSPQLAELLDSLNLTLPASATTLKPTIETPGFWFPSVVPAPPGSLTPFVVDPTSILAKKNKFLSDLFASKAAANAAALAAAAAVAPPTSPADLAARGVDPEEYSTKVSAYLNNLLDSTNTSKRASGIAPKKSQTAKTAKASKTAKPKLTPTNPPIVEETPEETPEDEVGLDQILALRRKREVEDETEVDDVIPETDAAAEKEKNSAALLNDMATVKQNILIQLDAMSKAQSAASKATKAAAKAAKKASTLAGILNLPAPTPVLPSTSLADFQQKIAVLTNLYSTLSDTQKNITSAPDASDPLNMDKLFIAAVNAKVNKILMRNALLPTAMSAPATKVARSNNWQRWRGQQDSENPTQYEADGETSNRQKSAVPLVAAVFAPQTYHYQRPQPNSWN